MWKFSRFRLRTLFILVFVVASGCAWLQSPRATAKRFVADPKAFANRGWVTDLDRKINFDSFADSVRVENAGGLQPHPRTLSDCLAGRQSFTYDMYHFTVERGTVKKGPRLIFLCV